MALMEWTENLELGVDRMDETHREFVAQLNALHAAPQDEFLPMLDAFIEHTVEHFAQEQHWMSEMEFPPMHCHLREHEGVLDIMREVRRMVSEGKTQVGPVLTRELGLRLHLGLRRLDRQPPATRTNQSSPERTFCLSGSMAAARLRSTGFGSPSRCEASTSAHSGAQMRPRAPKPVSR